MKPVTLFTDGTTDERDDTRYKHPNAYAAPPGTGPAGQTCGTCCFRTRGGTGRRSYAKCGLVRQTSGAGTDIVLKMPACSRWKSEE